MVEVLRFGQEFVAIDPTGTYSIEDFIDWMALSCAIPEQRIAGKLRLL